MWKKILCLTNISCHIIRMISLVGFNKEHKKVTWRRETFSSSMTSLWLSWEDNWMQSTLPLSGIWTRREQCMLMHSVMSRLRQSVWILTSFSQKTGCVQYSYKDGPSKDHSFIISYVTCFLHCKLSSGQNFIYFICKKGESLTLSLWVSRNSWRKSLKASRTMSGSISLVACSPRRGEICLNGERERLLSGEPVREAGVCRPLVPVEIHILEI